MNEEKRNYKGNLWVYAAVLFSSVFVILLITAYSQIKFNRSIEYYEKQIHSKENEKNKFLINLNSAIQQNTELLKEIESLKTELENQKENVSRLEQEVSKLKASYSSLVDTYENLFKASIEYKKGNILGCAEILHNDVEAGLLGEEARKAYDSLVNLSYKKAAHEFYTRGFKCYKEGMYSEAVKNFLKSIEFSDDEYFADDSYFLAAKALYLQGNKEKAKEYARALIDKFPSSMYLDSAYKIIREEG